MITDLQDDVVTPDVMQLGDGPLTDIGVEPGSVLSDEWDGVSDAITMQAQSAERERKMQQLVDVAYAKAGDKEAVKRVESDALLGWALTAEAAADAENTEDVLGTQLARRYGTGDPGAVWDAMNASADYEYEQMPVWNTRAEGMRLVWGRFQKMVQGKKAAAEAKQQELQRELDEVNGGLADALPRYAQGEELSPELMERVSKFGKPEEVFPSLKRARAAVELVRGWNYGGRSKADYEAAVQARFERLKEDDLQPVTSGGNLVSETRRRRLHSDDELMQQARADEGDSYMVGREQMAVLADVLSGDDGQLDKGALGAFLLAIDADAQGQQSVDSRFIRNAVAAVQGGFLDAADFVNRGNAKSGMIWQGSDMAPVYQDAAGRADFEREYSDNVEALRGHLAQLEGRRLDAAEKAKLLSWLLTKGGTIVGENVPYLATGMVGGAARLGYVGTALLGGMANAPAMMNRGIGQAYAEGKKNAGFVGSVKGLAQSWAEAAFVPLPGGTAVVNRTLDSLARKTISLPGAGKVIGAVWGNGLLRYVSSTAGSSAGELLGEEVLAQSVQYPVLAFARAAGMDLDEPEWQPFADSWKMFNDDPRQAAATVVYCALMGAAGAPANVQAARDFALEYRHLMAAGLKEGSARRLSLQAQQAVSVPDFERLCADMREVYRREVSEGDPVALQKRLKKEGASFLDEVEVQMYARSGVRDYVLKRAGILSEEKTAAGLNRISLPNKETPDKPTVLEWTDEQLNAWVEMQHEGSVVESMRELQARVAGAALGDAAVEDADIKGLLVNLRDLPVRALARMERTGGRVTYDVLKDLAADAREQVAGFVEGGMSEREAYRQMSEIPGVRLGTLVNAAEGFTQRVEAIVGTPEGDALGISRPEDASTAVFRLNGVAPGQSVLLFNKGLATEREMVEDLIERDVIAATSGENAVTTLAALEGMLRRVQSHLVRYEGGMRLLPKDAAASEMDIVEAFSKLAQSRFLLNHEQYSMPREAHDSIEYVQKKLAHTQHLVALSRAWDAFARSEEGRAFIEKEGATLEKLMSDAGASVAGQYSRARFDADAFEAVRLAYEQSVASPEAAQEVLREYESEQQELDHPQEQETSIPASASITGEVLPLFDSEPVNQETGEQLLQPGELELSGGNPGRSLVGERYVEVGEGSVLGVAEVEGISLSTDVPQFKKKESAAGRVAADEDGTTHELAGGWNANSAPIHVWRRTDGRLEVISGRHRLAHARRNGVKFIQVRVYDESAARDAAWAKLHDVEQNILDNTCNAIDVAYYFRHNPLTMAEAEARGLLPKTRAGEQTAASRIGLTVAANASDNTFALLVNGKCSAEDAYMACLIAATEEGQQLALDARAGKNGKKNSWEYVTALVRGAEQMQPADGGMLDLFGNDDSFRESSEKLARYVAAVREGLKTRLGVLMSAGRLNKKGDVSKELGVKVKTPRDTTRLIERLANLDAAYERLDPDLGIPAKADAWDGKSAVPTKLDELAAGSSYSLGGVMTPEMEDIKVAAVKDGSFSVSSTLMEDIAKARKRAKQSDGSIVPGGEMGRNEEVHLCSMPDVLRYLNEPNVPMVARVFTLRKLLTDHNLTDELTFEVVAKMNDPVLVIKESPTTFLMLLDMEAENKNGNMSPVVCAVEHKKGRDGVRYVVSAYPLDNNKQTKITQQFGKLAYCKYNNAAKFAADAPKVQAFDLLRAAIDGGYASSVACKDDIVKWKQQNTHSYSLTGGGNLAAVSPEMDARYMAAVERGDMDAAQRMVNEVARKRGYLPGSDYQGAEAFNGVAPSSNAYFDTEDKRYEAWQNGDFEGDISLADFVRRGMDPGELEWMVTSPGEYQRADKYKRESIEAIRKAKTSKQGKVTIYRAVPADVKEKSVRNGDWVTLSKAYAEYHISLQDWEKGRIIKQEVSIDDVWWDGNDVNEWGYDDGKEYAYRNTANNRKLLAPVTYDENGDIVPLSKRFNYRSADVSFSVIGRNARTWGKYTDRAFVGRDDGMWRAEIDASGSMIKWEDLRGKNVTAYRRMVAGWDKLPEDVRKAVEAYAEEVYDWQDESEKLNSTPESEFLEQYNKVQKMRDALKPKREEVRTLLNKLFVEHGGSAGAVLNMKSAELDELAMSLWGPYVESKVEDMLDLRPLWNGGMKLADVLEYPELYEAYPELADITVRYATMDNARGRAIYGDGERGILINRNLEGEWREIHSILLHEIQHHIQNIEGFSKGGNPSSARRLVDMRAAMGDADALALREHSDMELYLRIAGEIEARNVQHRMDWSADKRVAIPFNETLEYPGEALVTFSVQSVTADWKNTLHGYLNNPPLPGTPAHTHDMVVCPTPAVMQMVGAKGWDMVVTPGVLDKVMKGKHAVSVIALEQLPAALADPICIAVSDTPGCLEVVTELKEGQHNVLVAVQLSSRSSEKKEVKVNRIASMYGKERIASLLSHPMLYWDKAKARIWMQAYRLQLPAQVLPKRASGRKILKPADLVKYKLTTGLSFSLRGRGMIDSVDLGVMAREEQMQRLVSYARRESARWERTFAKDTPNAKAAEAMGAISSIQAAILRVLPPKYRPALAAQMRYVEVYARMLESGRVRAYGKLKSEELAALKEELGELLEADLALVSGGIWYDEKVSDSIWYDEKVSKAEAEKEAQKMLTRELGAEKLAQAAARMLNDAADAVERWMIDVELERVERMKERLTPRKLPNGKYDKGKMSAGAYKEFVRFCGLMELGADAVAEKLHDLEALIAAEEGKDAPDAAKVDKLAAKMAELAAYGNLKEKSLEAVRKGVAALTAFVQSERNVWQGKLERERERAKRSARVMSELMGPGDEVKLAENAEKSEETLRMFGDMGAGFKSLAQMFYGMGGIPGLRDLMDESLEALAYGHVQLGLRERRAYDQLGEFLEKQLGLDTEAKRNDWMAGLKKKIDTKVQRAGELVVHKLELTQEEAEGWLELDKAGREEKRRALLDAAEKSGVDAQNVVYEEDIPLLSDALDKFDDLPGKRKYVRTERSWRKAQPGNIVASRDEILNILLLCEQTEYQQAADENGYTAEVLEKLRAAVGEDVMAYGHELRKVLEGSGLAAVYEAREGIPFPAVQNYWPGKFDLSAKMNEQANALDPTTGTGTRYGMLITRVKHKLKFNLNLGASNVFLAALAQQNNYICMGELTARWRRLLSHSNFAMSLKQRLGDKQFKQLKELLNLLDGAGIAESVTQQGLSSMLGRFQSAHAMAVLAGSPITLIKQTSAMLHAGAWEGISAGRVLWHLLKDRAGKGAITYGEVAQMDCFKVRHRDDRYFTELMQMGRNANWSKLATWARTGMGWIEKMDVLCNVASMTALYNIKYEQLHAANEGAADPMSEEEIRSICRKSVEQAMELAAQPLRRTQKSALAALGRNALVKSACYMSSESLNKIGMYAAIKQRNGGGIKGRIAALKFLLPMSIAQQATVMALDMLRGTAPGSDDDEWAEWFWLNVATGCTGLGMLQSVPMLGEFVGWATGGYVKTASLGEMLFDFRGAVRSVKRLWKMGTDGKDYRSWEWAWQLMNAGRIVTAGTAVGRGISSSSKVFSEVSGGLQSLNAVVNHVRPLIQRMRNKTEE